MTTSNIGFIGAGVMGTPMCGHPAKAGYSVTLHDIDRCKAEVVAAQHENVEVADTPRAVAEVSDVVITMLPSGEYVRDVVLNRGGLIEGLQKGTLLLDTSSSEPWLTLETAKAIAVKDVAMVDAPVSGAEFGAKAAELVFMVGGAEQDVARISPLLEIMGHRTFHLGPLGSGHTMKCINNLITAMIFMATTEGMILGKRFGLDPDVMTDVLNDSAGMSWITQTHIKQRIISRKFDDPFKLELMLKDIGIAMQSAKEQGLSLPLSALGHELWKEADNFAGQGSSVSNMVRWVEEMTGTEITPGAESHSM